MMRTFTAAAVILAALVGLPPRGAEACTMKYPVPEIYPADGTAGLPTNAVFFVVWATDGFSAKLMGPQGEVPVRRDVPSSGVTQLVPANPLGAGETYRLEVLATDAFEPVTSTIRVGSASDEAKPPTPTLSSWTHYRSNGTTCGGPTEAYTFGVTDLGEAVAVRIFTGPTPEQVNFDAPTVMSFERPPALRNIAPDIAAAVQSVDAAGNLSEISAPKQIRTAGCSSVAAPPMALLLIALLRRGRRRK